MEVSSLVGEIKHLSEKKKTDALIDLMVSEAVKTSQIEGDLVLDAQKQAKEQITFVLLKARIWDTYANQLNERQAKVLNRMLREGPEGFEGGMSAQKYSKITECSKATATRDLTELLNMGAFRKQEGGGRSTRYDIDLPKKF